MLLNPSEPHLDAAIGGAFKYAGELSNVRLDFGAGAPEVLQIKENILHKLVSNTNPTTVGTLRDTIYNAFQENRTAQQLTRDIEKVWDGWYDYRAERIARTEAANAFGTSSFKYYQKAGIEHKTWMTMGDEKVALVCIMNEGQGEIPMDEAFESGDQHEPAHVNCRCSVVPAYIEAQPQPAVISEGDLQSTTME